MARCKKKKKSNFSIFRARVQIWARAGLFSFQKSSHQHYFIFFAPSPSSYIHHHFEMPEQGVLEAPDLARRAEHICSALLLTHAAPRVRPVLGAPLPPATVNHGSGWWPLAGRSVTAWWPQLLVPIDTAAGPAVNLGGFVLRAINWPTVGRVMERP